MAEAPPFGRWERTLALRYLRAKRKEGGAALISVISFAGITLAVMALIVIMSIMNGFRAELLSRIISFNGQIYVQGPAVNAPDREALIARLKRVPGVVQVAPTVEAQAIVIGPSQVSGAIVRAMRPQDVAATRIVSGNIKDGALKGFGEGEDGGDLILVGQRMAETMGVKAGDSLSLVSPSGAATAFGATPRRKSYTVGGVFSVGMSEYDAAFVYMPLNQAQLFFGKGDRVDYIEINLKDPDKIDAVRPEVVQAVGPAGIVQDWRDRNHAFFNALQVERTAMRLILMVVVAITTLNIISGLVMLVKNKTRDVAILRTIGASQGAILRIFFMAGAAIGVAGAITGLVLGALFCLNIGAIQGFVEWATHAQVFNAETYFLSRLPAKMDAGEVVTTLVWSLLMSCLFSVMPAWWASRFDPVEALRYE